MLICSRLSPPESDILKSNERTGAVEGGDEAFAAAGEEDGVADVSEGIVVVSVNRSIGCLEQQQQDEGNESENENVCRFLKKRRIHI